MTYCGACNQSVYGLFVYPILGINYLLPAEMWKEKPLFLFFLGKLAIVYIIILQYSLMGSVLLALGQNLDALDLV